MCHQTVSLIARHLEAAGLPTLVMGSALDIMRSAQPPRAVFVDYPLGHTTGKPADAADHLRLVLLALEAFESLGAGDPVRCLPAQWGDGVSWRAEAMRSDSGDTRQSRDTRPRYQMESDRVAAEG